MNTNELVEEWNNMPSWAEAVDFVDWANRASEQLINLQKQLDLHKSAHHEAVAIAQSKQAENTELYSKLDKMLAHCQDGECDTCSEIICPHKCSMHFHHDGCPACAEYDQELQK